MPLRHVLHVVAFAVCVAFVPACGAVVQSKEPLLKGMELKFNGVTMFRSDPPGMTSGFYRFATPYELQRGVGNVYLFSHDLLAPSDEEGYVYINDPNPDKPQRKKVIFEQLPGTQTYVKQFGHAGDFEYQLIKMIGGKPAFITLQCDKIEALDSKAFAGLTGLRNVAGAFTVCALDNRQALMNLLRYLDALPDDALLKAGSVVYLWPVPPSDVFKTQTDAMNDPVSLENEARRKKNCDEAASYGKLSTIYRALNCYR